MFLCYTGFFTLFCRGNPLALASSEMEMGSEVLFGETRGSPQGGALFAVEKTPSVRLVKTQVAWWAGHCKELNRS